IVCDDLIQFGGAEKVFLAIHAMWPDAPVYTSVASKRWLDICKEKKIDLHTSFMQKLPFVEKLNRYYFIFLLHIFAFESFDFTKYDVVLSLSARFAHFIITKPQTKHICYMHSPGRMFWEPVDYFENESFGFFKPIKALSKLVLSLPLSVIRASDYAAAHRVSLFIANSKTPRERIRKYYGQNAAIVYPFCEVKKREIEVSAKTATPEKYFLILTRLLSWKRVDIAIDACTKLGVNLKIIGVGPALGELQKKASSNIEFLGYAEDKKDELLAGCTALINTQKEDFGIVPLEAMSFGKPVIAYGEGGVLETVVPGLTGEFFYEQTAESLQNVLQTFDASRYKSEDCIKQAEKFNRERFVTQMQGFAQP
ncbi:MAG: group 1 glycosyl transferase, partial [uncultured bacterium]